MVTKDVLAKFLKLASDRIISGLESKKWSGDQKEAAITVLKNRGKDVSKYLDEQISLKTATLEELNELSTLINSAISKDDKELISKIYSIIGNVESISELPSETVEYAISSIKSWKKENIENKKIAERKFVRRSTGIDKRVKDQVLTDEHKEIVDAILNDKSLTKKQKIIRMFEQEISRTEVLALHFADATYIYDLHRDWIKNAKH